MSNIERLSDRHQRPVKGIGNPSDRSISIRLVAADLRLAASQHILVCLMNLLCRLTGSVASIVLDIDDAPIAVTLPHRASDCNAVEALMSMSAWANGNAVSVSCGSGEATDFSVCIGGTRAFAGDGINVSARGWLAWVGTGASPRLPGDEHDANPLGPYFSACLAAAEVFKFARGLTKGRFAEDLCYSVWQGKEISLSSSDQGPAVSAFSIPPFLLVGGGAVGQGFMLTLAALKPVAVFAVTIDHDTHEDTNLNRCFLAGEEDEHHPKVDAVRNFRTRLKVAGHEFQGTLTDFVADAPLSELPPEMAAEIAEDSFPLIISAVDRNDSRWDIQGLNPQLVIGGSTDKLAAKAIAYGADSHACLACHNPREKEASVFDELHSHLAGLDSADRYEYLRGKLPDAEIEAILEDFAGKPKCGSLGERALKAFAATRATEFSVSFVSMAASVMVLGRLLQSVGLQGDRRDGLQMTIFNFRNLRGGSEAMSRDPVCPHCAKRSLLV